MQCGNIAKVLLRQWRTCPQSTISVFAHRFSQLYRIDPSWRLDDDTKEEQKEKRQYFWYVSYSMDRLVALGGGLTCSGLSENKSRIFVTTKTAQHQKGKSWIPLQLRLPIFLLHQKLHNILMEIFVACGRLFFHLKIFNPLGEKMCWLRYVFLWSYFCLHAGVGVLGRNTNLQNISKGRRTKKAFNVDLCTFENFSSNFVRILFQKWKCVFFYASCFFPEHRTTNLSANGRPVCIGLFSSSCMVRGFMRCLHFDGNRRNTSSRFCSLLKFRLLQRLETRTGTQNWIDVFWALVEQRCTNGFLRVCNW